jgi:hypothetical protein
MPIKPFTTMTAAVQENHARLGCAARRLGQPRECSLLPRKLSGVSDTPYLRAPVGSWSQCMRQIERRLSMNILIRTTLPPHEPNDVPAQTILPHHEPHEILVRTILPHPCPLPLGEGESLADGLIANHDCGSGVQCAKHVFGQSHPDPSGLHRGHRECNGGKSVRT